MQLHVDQYIIRGKDNRSVPHAKQTIARVDCLTYCSGKQVNNNIWSFCKSIFYTSCRNWLADSRRGVLRFTPRSTMQAVSVPFFENSDSKPCFLSAFNLKKGVNFQVFFKAVACKFACFQFTVDHRAILPFRCSQLDYWSLLSFLGFSLQRFLGC